MGYILSSLPCYYGLVRGGTPPNIDMGARHKDNIAYETQKDTTFLERVIKKIDII